MVQMGRRGAASLAWALLILLKQLVGVFREDRINAWSTTAFPINAPGSVDQAALCHESCIDHTRCCRSKDYYFTPAAVLYRYWRIIKFPQSSKLVYVVSRAACPWFEWQILERWNCQIPRTHDTNRRKVDLQTPIGRLQSCTPQSRSTKLNKTTEMI